MLQLLAFRNRFALRRIDASVLEIGRARHCSTRASRCAKAPEGLIASVLRGQALSLGVAQLRAEYSSHRRARKTPLDSTPVCSSESYNVPTWLLDVAQALAQHSSASSRLPLRRAPCRVRVLPHARRRHRRARRDEAELLAACARRSTAPRTVGHANTLRLKSTEGQKSFVVSCSSALLGKRHS
jgi:hypothetical protein